MDELTNAEEENDDHEKSAKPGSEIIVRDIDKNEMAIKGNNTNPAGK